MHQINFCVIEIKVLGECKTKKVFILKQIKHKQH